MGKDLKSGFRTGVIHKRYVPWLWTEDRIDLAWVEHAKSCSKEAHSGCRIGKGPRLYGGWEPADGGYRPREDTDYALIARPERQTLQVVKSRFVLSCAQTSPCYPGQGDLETPGELLAFCPPPDLLDEDWLAENRGRLREVGEIAAPDG
ncbi:hypothetical protein [Halarsenatibacter silvermanii]|uniref:Uncharacterized protein n=1 Tax=Halarsenatibacter silvermanii TaxID=321763 RepID=A0A1G9HSA7_9FIRM|nr:hypothetical protein [Halarsenatibacter silvermanii]SDL15453.1 hypothetical protein SAMN04488692_10213 [Halarsenatibacter silvermanii]